MNNSHVCAWSRPRGLFPTERGIPGKIEARNNLLINVENAPLGNFVTCLMACREQVISRSRSISPRQTTRLSTRVSVGFLSLARPPTLDFSKPPEEP